MIKNKAKYREAFRLRLAQKSCIDVAKAVSISPTTLNHWENGWVDTKGRQHPGWKEKLIQLWKEQEQAELNSGLLLKKTRLMTYDKLARMVVAKIEEKFPNLKAKSASDFKALISEVRELCRLIAVEKGEYPSGGSQTVIGIKNDITLPDLQKRYIDVHANRPENAD